MKSPKLFSNLGVYLLGLIKTIFSSIKYFCKRLKKSVSFMNKAEKIFTVLFLISAIILSVIKLEKDFIAKTISVSAPGGLYKEAVYGDFKYLNPLLVSTDVEKAASKLVFSGLVKYDKDNNVQPDLAANWEVSSDGLRYTFYLKDNLFFHDGRKLTSDDVVYTVEKIKNPAFQSPLSTAWADVNVTAEDDNTVVFDLPRAYGPFIYNCDFGVVPSYLNDDQFGKRLIGTGPYKFAKTTAKDNKIVKLNLERNLDYFGGAPYIENVEMDFYNNLDQAKLASKDKNVNAVSGFVPDDNTLFSNLSFTTTKRLGLILNLRGDKLKDKATRQVILSNQELSSDNKLPTGEKMTLKLATLDNELQKRKAEELKNQFAEKDVDLKINYYNPVAMQEVVESRNYELLLFGFDFGHDRDPYVFWHSSQIDRLNFAGYSDKNSDILLEDARMLPDGVARNAKYDQFFGTVQSEALAAFYDPITFNYYTKGDVKDAKVNCNEVDYRFEGMEKWYIKTKRVRK